LACALWLGTAALGCSAEDPGSTNGRGRTGGGFPATAGGSGATAAAGSGAVAPGAGGSDNFGNPTGPAKMVGDGTVHQSDCLEPTVAFVIDGSGSM
jgi:hypothetical protein